MGRHASADQRRRIAAWPIVLVVVVLLLVGVTVAYFLIINPKKSAACTGSTVLPVTTSPGVARAVTDAATAFNATAPVARATCVSVSVSTLAGSAVVTGLAAGWKGQDTSAPALWVVDSAADVAAVDAGEAAMTAGHPNTALATSPLVLAVRAPLAAGVTWSAIASGSAPLVLTVPDPSTNRASGYALQSLIAAGGGSATVVDAAAVAGATGLFKRLVIADPRPPSSTDAALTQLAKGTQSFTAVPVVESELAAFNAAAGTDGPRLTAVYPTGATAGDELMTIPLTAPWVSDAMSDAAAAFDSFLGSAAGTAVLTSDHLRTARTPATVAGVDLTTKVESLPDAAVSVRDGIDRAWLAAGGGSATSPTSTGGSPTAPASSPVSTAPTVSSVPSVPTVPSGPAVSSSPTAQSPVPPTSPGTPATTPSPTTPTPTPTPTPTSRPSTTPSTSKAPSTTPSTPASTAVPPGPGITLVLDTSGSMNTLQGNLQRIQWMQAAVTADIQRSPGDLFGLWSFSTDDGSAGYTQLVTLGALGATVDGTLRASALTTALNALTPGGNSWTYGAIKAAYTDAVNSAVTGRPNRVVVVTDGLDTTPGLPRADLKADLAALSAQNKNVELDIIGLSTDVNATAMTEIAQSAGGSYTSVTNLSDLQPTLLALLRN